MIWLIIWGSISTIWIIVITILLIVQIKKLNRVVRIDLPFLIKCADTARDNDDALSKNQEILLKKIIYLEKQKHAYKSKHRPEE